MLKSLGNRGRKDKINAIRYPGKRFPLLGFFLGMQLAKVKNPK
jgi:CTP synthase (UTP-ammonia lyase)